MYCYLENKLNLLSSLYPKVFESKSLHEKNMKVKKETNFLQKRKM